MRARKPPQGGGSCGKPEREQGCAPPAERSCSPASGGTASDAGSEPPTSRSDGDDDNEQQEAHRHFKLLLPSMEPDLDLRRADEMSKDELDRLNRASVHISDRGHVDQFSVAQSVIQGLEGSAKYDAKRGRFLFREPDGDGSWIADTQEIVVSYIAEMVHNIGLQVGTVETIAACGDWNTVAGVVEHIKRHYSMLPDKDKAHWPVVRPN